MRDTRRELFAIGFKTFCPKVDLRLYLNRNDVISRIDEKIDLGRVAVVGPVVGSDPVQRDQLLQDILLRQSALELQEQFTAVEQRLLSGSFGEVTRCAL